MKVERWICDMKGCDNAADHKGTTLDVIFITETTEGRPTDPYIESQTIDICETCMQHLLQGNFIHAEGVMGYNTYFFKNS